MPYFAVDDRFHTHRKVMKLRRSESYCQAIALWTMAGSWCCAQERERDTGVIPIDVLASFGIPSWQQAMDALVLAGLWELCDDCGDDAVQFHDWDHWNVPGAAERRLEESRSKTRDRVRRHRERQRAEAENPRSESMERVGNVTRNVTSRYGSDSPGEGRAGEVLKPKVVETSVSSLVDEQVRDQAEPQHDPNDRPDTRRVCEHLADLIEANGSKRPTITKGWLNQARLMLDRDHREVDKVLKAIDWCQADPFWKANILSVEALRRQYEKLRLRALEEAQRPRRTPVGSATERFLADVPGLRELAADEGRLG